MKGKWETSGKVVCVDLIVCIKGYKILEHEFCLLFIFRTSELSPEPGNDIHVLPSLAELNNGLGTVKYLERNRK